MPDAVYVQALDLVKTAVESLAKTGIATDPTEVLRLDWRDIYTRQGVTVRFVDMPREIPQDGTNQRDAYGYPCHVFCVKSHEVGMTADAKAIHLLRQLLIRTFHNKHTMSGVTSTGVDELPTVVTNGPQPPREFTNHDFDVYSWTVWAWFLEPRS